MKEPITTRVTKVSASLRKAASDRPNGVPFRHGAYHYVLEPCPASHDWHVDNCHSCAPFWGRVLFLITKDPRK